MQSLGICTLHLQVAIICPHLRAFNPQEFAVYASAAAPIIAASLKSGIHRVSKPTWTLIA